MRDLYCLYCNVYVYLNENNKCFFLHVKHTVFGAYGNTRIMIRKRMQSYLLKELQFPSVISELRPHKILIEISKSKYKSLYSFHHLVLIHLYNGKLRSNSFFFSSNFTLSYEIVVTFN